MAESEFISYPVPEGYMPMSLPAKPETRVPKGEIEIEYCKESDFEDWAALLYHAFPALFWDAVENVNDRPPLEERIKLRAEHWMSWSTQPGFHALKAVHARTGEMMGIAAWHECGPCAVYPTEYKALPGKKFPPWFVPSSWRNDLQEELGIPQRLGWSDEHRRRLTAFDAPTYTAEFLGYDDARLRELGDQKHLYLAPLAVWEKWRGRGVGRELMQWGIDRADERGWPVILEAAPNARPVYYHLGFEPTASHGPFKDLQLVRPPKSNGG